MRNEAPSAIPKVRRVWFCRASGHDRPIHAAYEDDYFFWNVK
jgi:hypothetical protein